MRGHGWWQIHAETRYLVVEYNNPGGNSLEKEDVQEVATIKSTKYYAAHKEAKREAKRTIADERARAAQ